MSLPNLSALAVRFPSVSLFIILSLAAAGVVAFLQLGRAEDPSFTLKVMTVSVAWPGATAAEMQQQVADPLERRLQELRYYDRVETQARPGLVTMSVSLSASTPPAAVEPEFYQIRKKLSDEAAHLPQGIYGPFFNDEYSDVYFSLYALQADGLPERELITVAEDIRGQLIRVPGVKKVKLLGEQRQRMFVDISYQRLATLGLGLGPNQIIAALATQNLVAADAAFATSGPTVRVRVNGAFDDLAAVAATPLVAGGRTLRVGDVADISRGTEDPPTYLIRHDGKPSLVLGVVMRERADGTALGAALSTATAGIRAGLPHGMTLTQIANQADNIALAYGEFMIKFAVALGVVMAISLITLGFRVGIVVAATVPLTLAAVFVIMLASGRDFDRITLGALILSLGLLVDDAIIAIEMMVVRMEEGFDRIAAATYAWSATAMPMLSGTLVTIIGFLPVGFAQSVAGEYAGNIFWIVAFSLLVSWLVAVYATPYLGVQLLPKIAPIPGGHATIYATPWYQRLRRSLDWCLAHRGLVTLLTVAALGLAAIGLVVAIPKQFFPSSDRSEVIVEVYLPKGSDIAQTTALVKRIEDDARKDPETRFSDSYIGGGAPRFFLALNPELPDPAFAKLIIQTADRHARDRLVGRLAAQVAAGAYPEGRVRVTTLLFGPPVPYPVSYRISGDDLQAVRALAREVAEIVRNDPSTRDVHLDWGERAPTVRLHFDQERLRQLGFDPVSVARQVQALISGFTVSQSRSGNRLADVVVRAPLAERTDLGALGDLTLTSASGHTVTLANLAQLVPEMEDPLLIRRDRRPTITVQADVVAGVQPPDVTAAINQRLASLRRDLPAGCAIAVGGSAEESANANKALMPVFPLMFGLMLLVIMLQTRSFAMTGLTFATGLLGLIGAVPALLLTGNPFGFNAILGLIGLGGILMRNTLILVDQIEAEVNRGRDTRAAVIEATVQRSRPVLLTALAAVLAFFPLTFSTFWGPLAVVLIGGTLVGTVLTLFFLPALYALWLGVPRTAQ